MTTLKDFKQLRASIPAETQKEVYSLFTSDPEAALNPWSDDKALAILGSVVLELSPS